MRQSLLVSVALAIHIISSWGIFLANANVFADANSNISTTGTVAEPPLAMPSLPSSDAFVESEEGCGPSLAMCAQARSCFDHTEGCGEDGSTTVAECSFVLSTCKFCFPNSRCGANAQSDTAVPNDDDDDQPSGTFVGGTTDCGPELALCASAGPCFDHSGAYCAPDGSVLAGDCDTALPFCKPCFPHSRCGTGSDETAGTENEEPHESARFVESDTCGPELSLCQNGEACFDHTRGCMEDGSVDMAMEGMENCQLALDFCIPCFPNSRCGGGKGMEEQEPEQEPGQKQDDDKHEEDEVVTSQNDESFTLSNNPAASGAYRTTATSSIVLWIVSVGVCHLRVA